MADSDFAKEEIVLFDRALDKFGTNNITSRQVAKFMPNSTLFERSALEVHRPLPYRATVKEGLVLSAADFHPLTQLTVPSRLNANASAPSNFVSDAFHLNAVELNDPQQANRKVDASIQVLSSQLDVLVAREAALKGTLFVGTSTPITKYEQAADCEVEMTIRNVNLSDPRTIIMNPRDYNGLSANLANRDAPPTGVSLTAFERSRIPTIATFESFKTSFMPRLIGAAGTGWLLDGAGQIQVPKATDVNGNNVDNRTMLLTVDTGAGTVKLGDIFNIAGVNSVGMINKEDTGELQTFRVIARNSATEWVISPGIVVKNGTTQAEKEYANCDTAPLDNAVVTFLNPKDANANIFFQNDAIEIVHGSLATMDLNKGGVNTMRRATDSGIEILFARQSEIKGLSTEYRLTMWVQPNVLQPEMCGVLLDQTP